MKRIILSIFILTIFQTAAKAQSLKLGIEGGTLIIMGPDEFKDAAPAGLGMENGLNFGVKAKYEAPLSPFRFVGNISYSSFSAEEDYTYMQAAKINIPPYQVGYSRFAKPASIQAETPKDMHSEVTSNILNLGAGAEWKIIDWKISPYLAGGLFINYYETTNKEINIITKETSEYKDNGTRVGGFLGAGAEIKLLEKLSLDISAKYNAYDLMNTSEMEGFVGEANNGFAALFVGAGVMWRVF